MINNIITFLNRLSYEFVVLIHSDGHREVRRASQHWIVISKRSRVFKTVSLKDKGGIRNQTDPLDSVSIIRWEPLTPKAIDMYNGL